MRTKVLLLAVVFAVMLAPLASAQSTEDVTIDFSTAGGGILERDFYNLDGVLFDTQGFVGDVEGDEALHASDTYPVAGDVDGQVSAIAVRAAPDLRGYTGFFDLLTARLTLTALDESGVVVATRSETITTDSQAGTGFDYVTVDLGTLPRPASAFTLTGETLETDACPPPFRCPYFFAVSELRYTIERPATDTTPPTLTLPADITANAAGTDGARVSYSVRASDNRDPNPELSCEPASGSLFPVGTSTVVCTAQDASGNTAQESFDVTVRRFPDPTKDTVTGVGSVAGHDLVVDAQADPDGSNADGTLTIRGSLENFDLRVTCLNVAGDRATVGGEIVAAQSERTGIHRDSFVDTRRRDHTRRIRLPVHPATTDDLPAAGGKRRYLDRRRRRRPRRSRRHDPPDGR